MIGKESVYNIGITNIVDKKQIIKLDKYEKIEIYLGEKGIYKVAKNKKYGLIDKEGKVLISEEQDEIGMSVEDFETEEQGKIFFEIYTSKKSRKMGDIFNRKWKINKNSRSRISSTSDMKNINMLKEIVQDI